MPAPPRPSLLVLSAETEEALEEATARLARFLREHPDAELTDVAFTLQTESERLRHRRAVVCADTESAVEALEARDDRVVTGVVEPGVRPVVFMFPGQGSQYVQMGRGLYESEPVFRREVDTCSEILAPMLELDLRELLYPDEEHEDLSSAQLGQTRFTQPALVAVEHALARLWMSWGVQPASMIGHSNGESVAACLASVMSLEDQLVLAAERGRLMQERPPGDMLSIPVPEEKVLPLLGPDVALAAVNGPAACVVSGPSEAIAALQVEIDARGLPSRPLHTSHAFHSAMMDPVLEPLREVVRPMAFSPAKIACVSTVRGRWNAPDDMCDPQYWIDNVRQPVRFGDAARELAKSEEPSILLEVGPGRMLTVLMGQQRENRKLRTVLPSMRHPHDDAGDVELAVATLGRMWMAGAAIDWGGFHGDGERRRVELPGASG